MSEFAIMSHAHDVSSFVNKQSHYFGIRGLNFFFGTNGVNLEHFTETKFSTIYSDIYAQKFTDLSEHYKQQIRNQQYLYFLKNRRSF